MKHDNRFSKALAMKFLKAQGLTAKRVTLNGARVWQISDGRQFETIAQLGKVYKPKKGEVK